MTNDDMPSDAALSVSAKVRRRILPILAAGWFIAYIDRFNVSFAALQMNHALGLSNAAFGFGAGVFFIGYSLFEVPSNLALARIGARRWLVRIMVSWGVISMAMALTRGPATFYGLRFLLGAAEAGCFPGMAFYLSQWLTRRERTAALGTLATMAILSGVVGAPAAAGLLSLQGAWRLDGWQWLFIAEGLPALAIGAWMWRSLPDSPDDVPWLTSGERVWLRAHADRESAPARTLDSLKLVLVDRRYWLWALTFFCATAAGSAITLFRPIMLREVTGLSAQRVAGLTMIPALAGVAAILFVSRSATRHDERRLHAGLPLLIAGAGLALVGVTHGLIGALFVSSLAAIGAAAQPPLFASVSSAHRGSVNAVGIAFVNSISALGSFLGPFIVGSLMEGPGGLPAACLAAGTVMAAGGIISVLGPDGAPSFAKPLPQSAHAS